MSDQIGELFRVAREEGDYLSEQFVQWFLKEQVEEVATMTELLDVAERVKRLPDDGSRSTSRARSRAAAAARTRWRPSRGAAALAVGRGLPAVAGRLPGQPPTTPAAAARGDRRDPDQGADAREPPPRGAARGRQRRPAAEGLVARRAGQRRPARDVGPLLDPRPDRAQHRAAALPAAATAGASSRTSSPTTACGPGRGGRDRRRLPVPRHRHGDPPDRPRGLLACSSPRTRCRGCSSRATRSPSAR